MFFLKEKLCTEKKYSLFFWVVAMIMLLCSCTAVIPVTPVPVSIPISIPSPSPSPPPISTDTTDNLAGTSFEYTVKKIINENLNAFTFVLHGERVLDSITSDYYSVSRIDITNESGYTQGIIVDGTHIRQIDENYILEFDDWNCDGYLDFSLLRWPGGTMGNNPHYYWLWDCEQERYIENAQLENISIDCSFHINDNNQIEAYTKHGWVGHTVYYYNYDNGGFILQKQEDCIVEEQLKEDSKYEYRIHDIVKERIIGEMKVVSENYSKWEER